MRRGSDAPLNGGDDAGGAKTALITGASSGIGLEFSRLLASKGFRLVLVARHENALKQLASQLESQYKIETAVVATDLGKAGAAAALAAEIASLGLTIDVLINNAGRAVYGLFIETPLQSELEILQLNVASLTELTKHFLPSMVARGQGTVLNVASTAAFAPGPLMAVYYATKAYVLSFSEALANEVEGTGVTVTVLCPPATKSGFQAAAQMEASRLVKGKRLYEPKAVAEAGYAGMTAGRRVVVPGFFNWLSVQMAPFVPRTMLAAYIRALQARTET